MSDFIVGYRPQTMRFSTIQPPSGFVAEVRSSSRQVLSDRKYDPSLLKESAGSDYENSINKILSQELVSKDTLKEVTKKSIMQLLLTLMSGSRVTKIQGFINVSTVEDDDTLCLELNEKFQIKREPPICHDGLKFKVNSPKWEKSSTDFIGCPPDFVVAPSEVGSDDMQGNRGYLSYPNEVKVANNLMNELPRRRRDSEGSEKTDSSSEESGYSSNDRDSVSDEGCEDIADDGVSDISQLHYTAPCSRSVEPFQDVQSEKAGRLVMDLSVPCPADITNKTEHILSKSKLWSLLDTKSDEVHRCDEDHIHQVVREDTMTLPRSLKITDGTESRVAYSSLDGENDAPMDLSGDKMQVTLPEWKGQEKHTLDTTTPLELACKKCPTILPDICSYKEHALQFHQLHACVTCFKDFSSKNNLKRHVRIHTGSRPYKCGQCEKTFARRDDLKGHTLRHDYNKPFRCSLCRKGYTDRACVKNHMLKEHCSRLMQICPECGESFDRNDVFLEHKKSHPSLQQFACDTCLFIGNNHLMALKHKLLHSYKLFCCKPCNAYFSDPFGYTKHVRKHKKTPEFTCYVCCFCDSVLPTYDQYVRHEYSHAQGKLHECSVCKKQFKSKTSLLEHSYTHVHPATSTSPETVTEVEVTEMDCNENHVASYPAVSKAPFELKVCQALPMNHAMIPPENDKGRVENDQASTDDCLLDLSLKSHSSELSHPKELSCVDMTEHTSVVSDTPSPKMLSFLSCAPRNGCQYLETRAREEEKSIHECGSVACHTTPEDEKFKIVWQSPAYHNYVQAEESENMSKWCEKNQNPSLAQSETPRERFRPGSIKREGTNQRQGDRKDNRYHPIHKMFVSRFLAARAKDSKLLQDSKLLKEIGNVQGGILLKNESIARAVTSMSPPLLKANGQVHIAASGDSFRKTSSSDETKFGRPFPSSVVFGLTGKPCFAKSGVEESINDDQPRNVTQAVKTELMENDSLLLTATSDSDHATRNAIRSSSSSPSSPSSPLPSLEDRHKCGVCLTKFESFSQLENHSVNEHKRYLCEHCMRGFTARPNRDRHLRYHTGERPYKCDLCPSAFMRGDDLKNHRTSRHRTEQINCDKCLASFACQKDLDRHKRHSRCAV